MKFFKSLPPTEKTIVDAVFRHSCELLDNTYRFKFFTLHGTNHLKNLFHIAQLIENCGLTLPPDQKYILSLAICLHDLGMVVPLSDKNLKEIEESGNSITDRSYTENYIRNNHHELVDNYISDNFTFLSGLGVSIPTIGIVSQVAKAHRKVPLSDLSGITRNLGSLLRVIDELDIGSSRAPLSTFLSNMDSMDPISKWHWFKHCITPDWNKSINVEHEETPGGKSIVFNVTVCPSTENSIGYWLKQIKRQLDKSFHDDRAVEFIRERYNVNIKYKIDRNQCKPQKINTNWELIESQVLSSNKKSILIVDDEGRKYEDLFLPLHDDYHIEYAYLASDALTKFEAIQPDLVLIDLQLPSGGIWKKEDTRNFKFTGVQIARELLSKNDSLRIIFFSGSRHDLSEIDKIKHCGFIKKPIDPQKLEEKIHNVL